MQLRDSGSRNQVLGRRVSGLRLGIRVSMTVVLGKCYQYGACCYGHGVTAFPTSQQQAARRSRQLTTKGAPSPEFFVDKL